MIIKALVSASFHFNRPIKATSVQATGSSTPAQTISKTILLALEKGKWQ